MTAPSSSIGDRSLCTPPPRLTLFWAGPFTSRGRSTRRLPSASARSKDPEFGNPYNDIGAYLIGLERFDEAIPWLERAIAAKRYDPRHFPYFNLGRAYLAKDLINRAREQFQKALEIEPRYTLARRALENLRRMVN